MMWPNSIRARMTVGFAFFIAFLMLAVCAAFFVYTSRSDRKNADARLAFAALEIQRELRDGEHSLKDPAELVREENEELRAADVAIMVVDKGNRVLAQSRRAVLHWPPQGDEWRTTNFQVGTHTVVIGVEWHKTAKALHERTLFLLGLSAFVVAFSSLGAWVLVGRTLAPIDGLARQATAASTESLRVQLAAPSPDAEITHLVVTLNDLLARLGETAATRGRFYAAASHELRTPLQALTGHLEVALSRQRDAEDYKSALHEAHSQAERLTALVQDLLLLNQLEADTSRPPGVLLDIGDMCVSELSPLRSLAAERGLTIELSLPDACEISASWNHATMLLRNLLENAVKYATRGGNVRVQLIQSTLTICNDCAPVAGWDTNKYFEPFFRPDASRNSQTGGNGLGLAICKAICTSNGWDISLHHDVGGVCALVRFKGV
ncbi:MAG TPA: histidine kinase dimerization/phospho-acceptor domain-containing protein [Abditibacteriaceae bacterium]